MVRGWVGNMVRWWVSSIVSQLVVQKVVFQVVGQVRLSSLTNHIMCAGTRIVTAWSTLSLLVTAWPWATVTCQPGAMAVIAMWTTSCSTRSRIWLTGTSSGRRCSNLTMGVRVREHVLHSRWCKIDTLFIYRIIMVQIWINIGLSNSLVTLYRVIH